jgi:alpha-L-fucosidase
MMAPARYSGSTNPRSVERLLTMTCKLFLVSVLTAAAAGSGCQSFGQNAAPTASTSDERPEEIAGQWIKATSKFDSRRAEILAEVDKVGHQGRFRPDWNSLSAYEVPEWYKDAKFGIFIHWGVYSVPAFGSEWYPREMYLQGSDTNKHHLEKYGPLTSFGYKDFIPMFKAEKYDPAAWATLFKDAGAMYVVPVFEHHDGFQMYDSDLSDWTAKKMGPKRDLWGDLAREVRARGMHLGASSHRIEHDWFLDGGRKQASDVNDPKYAAFYGPAQMELRDPGNNDDTSLDDDWTYVSPKYAEDWVARSAEIVEKYHPDLIYYDWWIGQPSIRPYLARFAAYYYNESSARGGGAGPVGIIDYKYKAMQQHSGLLDLERGQLAEIHPTYWQTDTSVSNTSWGYIEHDTFKTPAFIVRQLVDIVSKNGNLLLNIGPRSNGTIPDEVQQVLLSVGEWLKVNGDAIYGTRPWRTYGEGPTKVKPGPFHDTDTVNYTSEDFRFTTKGNDLFAIEFAWSNGSEAVVKSLSAAALPKVQAVHLLGSDAPLKFAQGADGLHIQLPAKPAEAPAYAFRVSFDRGMTVGTQ